jgi:hypothetical protein
MTFNGVYLNKKTLKENENLNFEMVISQLSENYLIV